MSRQRILLIEDDPELREALATILNSQGYAVAALASAFGAMGLAHRQRPCVILLDIGLPYRSGASLLAELKADPSTTSIPVIVISGHPEVLAAPRHTLATAILTKPFDLETLLDAVRVASGS